MRRKPASVLVTAKLMTFTRPVRMPDSGGADRISAGGLGIDGEPGGGQHDLHDRDE